MPGEYYDPERDEMEEQAAYFYRDMMMVEDTDIKNDLIWLHRLIFNPFVCDPTKYTIKNDENQDAIKDFRKKHPDFEIDFSRYGLREE
jgi:hypothetical protein